MNSQEDTVLINILLDLKRKLQYIFLDIQKLHEVPVPMNQEPSQSEIPTSGYGQNIEGCAL